MTRKYLGLAYEFGKKIMPWLSIETRKITPFIPNRVRIWGNRFVEVAEFRVPGDTEAMIVSPYANYG